MYDFDKMTCKAMQLLYGAVPVPCVPVRVTRGALVAHRYTYVPPRCRASQYRMTFIHLSVSLWNKLADYVSDCVGLEGFKNSANVFFIDLSCSIHFNFYIFLLIFLSLLSVYRWYCGLGSLE